jgi:hypothetical protein
VKFADSKKQLKLKEEGGGISLPDSGSSDGPQSQLGSAKMPDFWAKQFQLQQTQQYMYSYALPNGNNMMQQQQQLLPVPLSMPYGSHGNSQQQQYLYMQQQQQQSSSIPGYSYELSNTGHNGDGSEGQHQQSRYPSQPGYSRQQQVHSSAPIQRDHGQGQGQQRSGSWPHGCGGGGGRNDKMRGNDNSSGSNIGNHYQQQDDLYAPLDSNGEMSSRSLSSNQRPPEGE